MSPTPLFQRVSSYAQVAPYFDEDFNMPRIPEEMSEEEFEQEFDRAHEVLIRHLNEVGRASEKTGEPCDFSLYRWVDIRRAINVVSDKHAPEVIFAVQRAQRELPADYVINLDSSSTFISILPSGEVLGFGRGKKGSEILDHYGFPPRS